MVGHVANFRSIERHLPPQAAPREARLVPVKSCLCAPLSNPLCERKSSQIIWNVHCPTRAPHRTIRDKHGQTFRLDRCRDNHVLVVTFLGTCSSLCPVDEEQSRLDLASADLALFSLRLATLSANILWKKQSGRKPFQGCLKKSGRKPQNVSSKGCGSACEDVSLVVQNEQRMSILERWN